MLSLRAVAAALILGIAWPTFASRARAQASADLPLDDNAYYYIDALLARGALRSLSALERPYKVHEVAALLDRDSVARSTPMMRSFARALRTSMRKYDPRVSRPDTARAVMRYQIGGDVYATGQTSGIRELMLGDGKQGLDGAFDARGVAEGGPLAIVFRGGIDRRLMDDPQYWNPNPFLRESDDFRVTDGYVDARFPFAELFIGREARNWGPEAMDGLLLGHYAYTYDHFYALLGVRNLHYQILATRLNNEFVQPDTVAQRYFTIHRLAARVGPVEFAGEEAVVYGGPGRGFEVSYLNPVNLFTFSQLNEGIDGTKKLSAQVAVRTRSAGTYAAEVYLNDIQTGGCNPAILCKKPPSGGWTLTAEGIPFIGEQRLFASYTLVSFLDYRTDTPWEQYDYNYIGLGRGFSDYDEWRFGVDLAVVPGVPLKVYGAYRRQGQGDYLTPVPPADSFPLLPAFLFGTVEHVYRAGVTGAASFKWLDVSGDIGINHVTNYNHIAGVTHDDLAARIQVMLVWARIFGGALKAGHDDGP